MRWVWAGLGLVIAATAVAETAAIAAQTGNAGERRICRTPRLTATRLRPRPICHTQAEWQEIERERQRQLESEGQMFRAERTESQPRGPASPN